VQHGPTPSILTSRYRLKIKSLANERAAQPGRLRRDVAAGPSVQADANRLDRADNGDDSDADREKLLQHDIRPVSPPPASSWLAGSSLFSQKDCGRDKTSPFGNQEYVARVSRLPSMATRIMALETSVRLS
jgi:hypothetical protein